MLLFHFENYFLAFCYYFAITLKFDHSIDIIAKKKTIALRDLFRNTPPPWYVMYTAVSPCIHASQFPLNAHNYHMYFAGH